MTQKPEPDRNLLDEQKRHLKKIFLGRLVENNLRDSNISRQKIADTMAIDVALISKWISEERIPTMGMVDRFAEVIGLSDTSKHILMKAAMYTRLKRELSNYVEEAEILNVDPENIVENLECFYNEFSVLLR